eukprot:CAMPEP_0203718388 /NCGR_PEP_ID=MMETSP0092-20131115/2677_1 /ASSEMBLY_ACC=CAM_ASM_001090 /TAXON_ID=426623 /ORGANISM="Chaetoceros affinis, Strain CCMP159" /LENGTH=79 /DNA_ID=CAMNT_0050597507 /DNA_START=957 /DNA_END=1196 /DNA_ORIENTATION=-
MNAFALHVAVFPTPHSTVGVPFGDEKGPVMYPIDANISPKLNTKMMRRYGVDNPVPDFRIITTRMTDAIDDNEADEIVL